MGSCRQLAMDTRAAKRAMWTYESADGIIPDPGESFNAERDQKD